MNIFKQINFIFNKKQKVISFLLCIAIIIGTLLELIGVAALLPFINVIIAPNSIFQNKILFYLYDVSNVKTSNEFMIWLAVFLIIIYVIKNAYMCGMYYLQYWFVNNMQRELSNRLMRSYLEQPYLFYIKINTADLQRNIVNDVGTFTLAVLGTINLVKELCVSIALSLYLMTTDIMMTSIIVCFLSISVLCLLKPYNTLLKRYGEISRISGSKVIQWINQSFGCIKELIVLEKRQFFIDNFDEEFKRSSNAQKNQQFFCAIPKSILEVITVISLLLVIILKLYSNEDMSAFVPQLSVFAVATFRLLPSFNSIAGAFSSLFFTKSAVKEVHTKLYEASKLTENSYKIQQDSDVTFKQRIDLKDISFKYPNTEQMVFQNAKITIRKGESIAFIGPSGAGKTTLADILLGVLTPTVGRLEVDGIIVDGSNANWHKILGYIPQNIYLMDDNIANNIAFGEFEYDIDLSKIWEVLEEAQLKEFVRGLEDGLDTQIGENGVRLSGGQRQRIGIARALYRSPEILILDEATSALDNDTEKVVMEAIERLHGKITLIIIAHRLTTIQDCDYVYEVNDGKVALKKKRCENEKDR